MKNALPTNTGEILDGLEAERAVSFSRGVLKDLIEILPEDSRLAAGNLDQALGGWERGEGKESMAFYREEFDPLIDFFFEYQGTEFAPSVTLLCRVAAYVIKRINAFERERDGAAAVLPDDVREVDGRDVYRALQACIIHDISAAASDPQASRVAERSLWSLSVDDAMHRLLRRHPQSTCASSPRDENS